MVCGELHMEVTNLQLVKGGLKFLRKSFWNCAPQSLGKGDKGDIWIQGGFKKFNACDRTLISYEELKWGDILDVEILCLQVWEGWWCRVN